MGRKQINKERYTEAIIIASFCSNVLRTRSYNRCYPNYMLDGFECDLLELFKSGYLYEVEVKLTTSDFRADFNKERYGDKKHDLIKAGKRTNYFSYCCPEGVITPEMIPPYAGLVYFNGYTFTTVVRPPRLTLSKVDIEQFKVRAGDIMYYRYINKRIQDSLQ